MSKLALTPNHVVWSDAASRGGEAHVELLQGTQPSCEFATRLVARRESCRGLNSSLSPFASASASAAATGVLPSCDGHRIRRTSSLRSVTTSCERLWVSAVQLTRRPGTQGWFHAVAGVKRFRLFGMMKVGSPDSPRSSLLANRRPSPAAAGEALPKQQLGSHVDAAIA